MKRLLLFCTLVLSMLYTHAQTYVSGGIYANTTWTKAASPYIVTDTVVVFPGVTLTIEPGVTMKFVDTSMLEIRQAKIIAIGTVTDSILFTSNNPILKPGNWGGILINLGEKTDTMHFSFCSIKYADYGILSYNGSECKTLIKNSNFVSNVFGIKNHSRELYIIDSSSFSYNSEFAIFNDNISTNFNILNCTLKKNMNAICSNEPAKVINSTIDSNVYGFEEFNGLIDNCNITNNREGFWNSAYHSKYIIKNSKIINNSELGIIINSNVSIVNCEIRNNKIGILGWGYHVNITNNIIEHNDYGVVVTDYSNSLQINCNKICSNSNYDIKYQRGGHNISFPNNYFCTPDSASTRPRIFDGYVDVEYGLVNYMPLDSNCYKTLGIRENTVTTQTNTKLYPNPFSQTTTLEFENPQSKSCHLSVFNSMGQLVMSIDNIKNNKVLIDRKELQSGLYFYQLRNEEAILGTGKMMLID